MTPESFRQPAQACAPQRQPCAREPTGQEQIPGAAPAWPSYPAPAWPLSSACDPSQPPPYQPREPSTAAATRGAAPAPTTAVKALLGSKVLSLLVAEELVRRGEGSTPGMLTQALGAWTSARALAAAAEGVTRTFPEDMLAQRGAEPEAQIEAAVAERYFGGGLEAARPLVACLMAQGTGKVSSTSRLVEWIQAHPELSCELVVEPVDPAKPNLGFRGRLIAGGRGAGEHSCALEGRACGSKSAAREALAEDFLARLGGASPQVAQQ